MKVTQNPGTQAQNVTESRAATKPGSTKGKGGELSTHATPPGGSSVEISDNALLMKKASELAHSAPDVRRDKVDSLKKAIASGKYNVGADQIAEKLLDEHVGSDFGKNNL